MSINTKISLNHSNDHNLNQKNHLNKQNFFILIASLFGNMMEYFDFTLYSIFAISLGQTFFPKYAQETQILLSFSIFAIGFLTRPMGGIVFGLIGTYFGKKTSLIISSFLMSLATLCISFIPSYEKIGIYSSYLLILARSIQGFCVSGEGAVVAVYVLENIKSMKKGLITGVVHASNLLGTVLAGLLGIYVHYFLPDFNLYFKSSFSLLFTSKIELWRIGFLIGGILSFIGFILRVYMNENYKFLKHEVNFSASKTRISVNEIESAASEINLGVNEIKISPDEEKCNNSDLIQKKQETHVSRKINFVEFIKNYNNLLTIVVAGLAASIIYIGKSYLILFFSNKYQSQLFGICYTTLISLLTAIMMPFAGILNDNFGVLRVLKSILLVMGICIIPTFFLLNNFNIYLELSGILLLSCMIAVMAATSYLFCISLFASHARFFNIGFSYNLGVTIFGGITPMISVYLVNLTHLFYAPGFYILFLIFLVVLVLNQNKIQLFEI